MWIEITEYGGGYRGTKSLPTRECGLKYDAKILFNQLKESLPTRECGLKFLIDERTRKFYQVTPYAGVWIEI